MVVGQLGPVLRQFAVLAPAFGAHTAWIAQTTLVAPGFAVHLEDAVGAAALLWLAPRCRQALAAQPPPACDRAKLSWSELLNLVCALAFRYQLSGTIGTVLGRLLSAAAPGFAVARATGTMLGHLAWVALAVQLLGERLAFFAPNSGWLSLSWRDPWLRWVLAGFAASSTAYTLAAGAVCMCVCVTYIHICICVSVCIYIYIISL